MENVLKIRCFHNLLFDYNLLKKITLIQKLFELFKAVTYILT